MRVKKLGRITGNQDGAIYGGYIFRFNSSGLCRVYALKDCLLDSPEPQKEMAKFYLGNADKIIPHCNSVAFGNEFYSENDIFPLLYCNVYNNYANAENKMKGATCVYRLQKTGDEFSATLVQIIEIGFTDDTIWRSENATDVRPYGNCALDCDASIYYAFTMRDEDKVTRYFAFDLPKLADGEYDEVLGVNRVTLEKSHIKDSFDCEYHRFMQGACCHKGIIYSVEGFTNSETNPPAIRVIDPAEKVQKEFHIFTKYGMNIEPEMVDFDGDTCYYSDNNGNLFELEF